MVSTNHKSFRADDRSYFGLVKREIQKMTSSAGFDRVRAGKVDIIVSEMTSNLAKHASGGEILVSLGVNTGGQYIEIISLDDGPGISDLGRVLADGFSSVSTLGHGLGSIKRLSDQFDLYSVKGWGTIALSRIYTEELPQIRRESFEFCGVNISKPGENVSGDGYCLVDTPTGFKVLIADGLGHGKDANAAVQAGIDAFRGCEETSPTETIRQLHVLTRKTRGMVAAVVCFDRESRKWTMAGVGNISLRAMGRANTRNMVSYNGIVGHNIPTSMNDLELTAEEFPQFMACSDGIRSRWDLAKFPLIYRHSGSVAAVAVYKEFSRRTDDASVVVCKS